MNLKMLFKRDLCCSMGVALTTPSEHIFVSLNQLSLTITSTIQYELVGGAVIEQSLFYLGNKIVLILTINLILKTSFLN